MNTATASPTNEPQPTPVDHEMDHEMERAAAARLKMGLGQKAVVALLLTVVLVPPLAGFYSYFSGVPLHLLAAKKDRRRGRGLCRTGQRLAGVGPGSHAGGLRTRSPPPWESARASKTRSRSREPPTTMRPLVLPGSTDFDPTSSRPHPRSIRSGQSGRVGPGPGSFPQDRTHGVPRAEAGRHRLQGRSPGGFLQCGRGIQEERSPGCPGATGAGPEDSRRGPETRGSCPESLYAHV